MSDRRAQITCFIYSLRTTKCYSSFYYNIVVYILSKKEPRSFAGWGEYYLGLGFTQQPHLTHVRSWYKWPSQDMVIISSES